MFLFKKNIPLCIKIFFLFLFLLKYSKFEFLIKYLTFIFQIGLGKTTLAHTIARHAGYTVREINASDDRSPEAFRLALQNGTEMQTTLLDQEKRPNCIILGMVLEF